MKNYSLTKLKMQRLLSILTTIIGMALMIFMIVIEDEPGAIPIALIVIGTGWYFTTRSKIRARQI